jgi:peroxiredoxin
VILTMRSATQLLSLVLLASIALNVPAAKAASSSLATGQPAPDFALRSMSGPNLRLSELRGHVVMINFWATWCGPCREEMPKLNEIYRLYHGVGFDLLGVNMDDGGDRAVDMARTLGVTFPVLFDDGKTVARSYNVSTMPMTLLIGRDGNVRYVHQGYERGYEQTYLDQVRSLLKE